MAVYEPLMLNSAKEKIAELHKNSGKPRKVENIDSFLKELVYKIVSLEDIDIQSFAFTLSKAEISALSLYIFMVTEWILQIL